MRPYRALVLCLLGSTGCTDTVTRQVQIGSAAGIVTTADLRTITERPLSGDASGRRITCTEPPPDVAKALSTAFDATAKVNVPSGANGQGSVSNATAESMAELAGRVPGLIALRDTLFRACEGYADGMLGDDVYSLIASRYGELMVTLMLADVMRPTAAAATLAATQIKTSNSGGVAGPQPDATPPKQQGNSADPNKRILVASLAPITIAAANADDQKGQTTGDPKPAQPPASNGGSGAESSNIPAVLERMQHNYFTIGLLQPLVVACINEWDPSRAARRPALQPGAMADHGILSEDNCNRILQAAMRTQQVQAWAYASATLKKAGVTTPLPFAVMDR